MIGKVMKSKLVRCIRQAEIDALLLFTSPYSYSDFWPIFGTNAAEGGVVTTDGEMILLTWHAMARLARKKSWADRIVTYSPYKLSYIPATEVKQVTQAAKDVLYNMGLHKSRIGIESPSLPGGTLNSLERVLPEAKLFDISQTLNRVFAVKNPEELSELRRLAKKTDNTIAATISSIRSGITEGDLYSTIVRSLSHNGFEAPSIGGGWVVVLSGARSAQLGGYPSARRLRRRDFVLFDFQPCEKGCYTDICRTTVIGQPTRKQRKMLETVLDSWGMAFDMLKPGVSAGEVDMVARDHIEKGGCGHFTHHLGHPMGGPWGPMLVPGNEAILEEGMTLTLEPGVYAPGLGGVRIEDDVVITSNGAKRLTSHEQAVW